MTSLVTVTEAARMLRVSRPMVHKVLKEPDAPRSVKIGRRRLIPEAELNRWLTARLERAGVQTAA